MMRTNKISPLRLVFRHQYRAVRHIVIDHQCSINNAHSWVDNKRPEVRTYCHVRQYGQSSGIFALSSGFGKCGVSVIRVSGNGTQSALLALGKKDKLPAERKAVLWDIFHPKSGIQLDKGLVLWFKGKFISW